MVESQLPMVAAWEPPLAGEMLPPLELLLGLDAGGVVDAAAAKAAATGAAAGSGACAFSAPLVS